MDNTSVGLEMAVGQADDAIMVTDLSGVIRYVNSAFERLSGYSPAEVVGRHVRILKSDKHDAAFYRHLWETLSRGEVWRGIFLNKRKDGRLYEDETAIAPVRNDAGAVVSYVAVKHDVTADRQRERLFRQDRVTEAIGRLAGGVAHDFNNALMTIMGYAEMLEARLAETAASSEEIAEIKAACDRAASLTRQLLAFGRRQVRDLVVVDLNRVVVGLEKMLRRLLGAQIDLAIVPYPAPTLVRFEFGYFEQIMMTLAVRAREAMPAGGAFTIAIADHAPWPAAAEVPPPSDGGEGWAEVRVTDTGLGIDADAQTRIFEPFSSGRPQPWEAGLGLAVVHEMIRQSGGRIRVHSAPGEGTTFTMALPRVAPDDASLIPTPRQLQSARGTETVLLAEDEEGVRDLVRVGLTRLGYRVIEAPDGATALGRAAMHGGSIDLLITDLVMPGMSGRELADRLVALYPEAKVVYMSGYSDDFLGDQGVYGRGSVFLQKPFTPEAVARTVRQIFDGRT